MIRSDLADAEDHVLVARARAGDDAAFGELARRHQRPALRVAAAITGSTDDAPDVVQDAFVRAHGRLASYRADGSVRSWLLRIVANQSKNHLRSQGRRRRLDDRHARLALRSDESAETAADRRSDRRLVAAALGRLSRRDREVLGCRYLADLSEAETAQVLGVAVGTVKSRTSRALGRLARELTGAAVDEDVMLKEDHP